MEPVIVELQKKWPENRTINLVFHGHSVPAGYFRTPHVNTLAAYPHLVLQKLKKLYPNAVINVITTAIGGENSESGHERFISDVLTKKPDVVFIDYALNDRNIGLVQSQTAWQKMIGSAQAYGCKIVLLTSTPDTKVDILDTETDLFFFSQQIRELAIENGVSLVDSYEAFRQLVSDGENLNSYMSQNNHPNEKGHKIVAEKIIEWFTYWK